NVRPSFVSRAELLDVANDADYGGIEVVIDKMDPLANGIFVWPVALGESSAYNRDPGRIMRITFIKATSLKERNPYSTEVFRAGIIRNCPGFLPLFNGHSG